MMDDIHPPRAGIEDAAEMAERSEPGPRNAHEWPGTMREYERRTARFADEEYSTS